MISTAPAVRAGLGMICALLLIGCLPKGLTPTRLDDTDKLPDRFGVVAVQVVSNTQRLTPALHHWTSVAAVDLDDTDQRYRLEASGTGLLNSRVFVGALPPGQYALFNLHAFRQVGDVSMWMNAPIPRSLGTFRTDQDRISSLGTIVYQPLGRRSENGREGIPYLVTRFDEHEDLTEFVAEAYPDVFARLDTHILLGWDPDPHVEMREELVDTIRRFAVGLDYHWLGEGRIAMTGPVGQYYWREPRDGQWQRVDTGLTVQLGTIVSANDGYLAAGERGTVLQAESIEGPWEALPGPGTQEAVYWIHESPGGERFALARAGEAVHFYVIDDEWNWNRLQSFEYSPGMFFTGAGQVHAMAPGDGTVVIFGDRQRIVYRIATGEMDSESNPNHFAMARQPNGILVSVPGNLWSGIGSPVYSVDGGRNWDKVPSILHHERWKPNTQSVPVVLESGDILAVAHRGYRNERTRRIDHEEEPRLRSASGNQGIDSWGAEMDTDCTRLLPEISTAERVFATCSDGRVLRTEDGGATWELDHETGMDEEDAPESLRGDDLVDVIPAHVPELHNRPVAGREVRA